MARLDERPTTKRWTADEVWRMVEVGLLDEDDRYELIDGELLAVSPQGEGHARVIEVLTRLLVLAYTPMGWTVRVQMPTGGIPDAIPEPDLAVRRPLPPDQGSAPRPDQTVLLIEVAVTSHRRDRRKSAIYAAHGASEFWLVDLVRREVLVHRLPLESGDWGRVTAAGAEDRIALPGVEAVVSVDEVMGVLPAA